MTRYIPGSVNGFFALLVAQTKTNWIILDFSFFSHPQYPNSINSTLKIYPEASCISPLHHHHQSGPSSLTWTTVVAFLPLPASTLIPNSQSSTGQSERTSETQIRACHSLAHNFKWLPISNGFLSCSKTPKSLHDHKPPRSRPCFLSSINSCTLPLLPPLESSWLPDHSLVRAVALSWGLHTQPKSLLQTPSPSPHFIWASAHRKSHRRGPSHTSYLR